MPVEHNTRSSPGIAKRRMPAGDFRGGPANINSTERTRYCSRHVHFEPLGPVQDTDSDALETVNSKNISRQLDDGRRAMGMILPSRHSVGRRPGLCPRRTLRRADDVKSC